jgi:hypothetical protein
MIILSQEEKMEEQTGSVVTQEQEAQPTLSLDEALDALRKTRQEAAAARVKRKEIEEEKVKLESTVKDFQSKFDGLKDYEEIKSSYERLKEENKTLKLKTQLTGKVIDVDKAIKLIDDSYLSGEGQLDVDKFLAENQFLAVKQENSIKNPAINKAPVKNTEPTIEELKNLPQKDLIKYFEERNKRR